MQHNNKGFSLVELIVVVLIIGILSVSLTPQVIKWISNARTSNDLQLINEIQSAAQTTLLDKDARREVYQYSHCHRYYIHISKSGTVLYTADYPDNALTSSDSDFCRIFSAYIGKDLSECKLTNAEDVVIVIAGGDLTCEADPSVKLKTGSVTVFDNGAFDTDAFNHMSFTDVTSTFGAGGFFEDGLVSRTKQPASCGYCC